MKRFPNPDDLYDELCRLTDLGPRFHGESGEEAAAEYIHKRLSETGAPVRAHAVATTSWHPRGPSHLTVTSPHERSLECWPLLWTAGSGEQLEGTLHPQGPQGFWDNSFTWTKFAVLANDRVVGYVSARDKGPAAPQPLPSGSAPATPHLAIGASDGRMLSEWIDNGSEVHVRFDVRVDQGPNAIGHNLELAIPGRDDSGAVVVCGHYDTFWNTVGAYDNGTGTVALLELARRWTEQPPRRPVRLILFAAEEWHLSGSRTFVSSLRADERSDLDLVLNVDGLGRGDSLECSVGPELFESELTAEIRRFGSDRPNLRAASRFPPLMGTDHAPFYAAGIPSAHLTFNDWELLHRPEDVPKRDGAPNIAWTVGLVQHLVDNLDRPDRAPYHDIL